MKIITCFWAVFCVAAAAAENSDKPSPVHYKSSTAPAQSQRKPAPPSSAAAESSRNRVADGTSPGRRSEVPPAQMVNGLQTGTACFYGVKAMDVAAGKPQASEQELRAAHASLPLGSRVQVTNTVNGRTVQVTITDRIAPDDDRIISVSRSAAEQLGFVSAGTARVKLELLNGASRM
ncbi:MAG: septal ring lytic transglycosylase RlpA family protein [Bryobacteraceae bacterium]